MYFEIKPPVVRQARDTHKYLILFSVANSYGYNIITCKGTHAIYAKHHSEDNGNTLNGCVIL